MSEQDAALLALMIPKHYQLPFGAWMAILALTVYFVVWVELT